MMNRSVLPLILKWIAGFGLSLLAIWGITAVFTENFYPKVWAEQLGRNVSAPGWSFNNRSEAWARNDFGKLGLVGVADISTVSAPKVLIWGDSFVEAFQVPDSQKMHSQLTGMLSGDPAPQFQAVGVGRRFQSFADYPFQIPKYERAIADCRLHVIHLFTLEDVYPDRNPADRISLFLTEPELHFEPYDNEYREIEAPVASNQLKDLVFKSRLQFFLRTKKKLVQIAHLEGLRFALGSQSLKGKGTRDWSDYLAPEWVSRDAPVEAWKFALETLDEATDVPILFVYAPTTPTLSGGEVIKTNPERALADVFADLCRQNGFGFISMEEAFLNYQEETGRFTNGFSTSRPWEGHYNENGHRLVAQAVHDWMRENRHDLHPD